MKISDLQYEEKGILHFFEEISKIPRVSGNTSKIADYLEGFAKKKCLKYYRDGADNVVIYKNASAGFENRPTVILQGHTDMVGAVAYGVEHDFSKEGVHLSLNGDKLRACGTTLGADNGTAVAYMLALLDDDGAEHPTLECVFTSDEEIGLIGATALDGSVLNGRIMINMDSGGEGTFIVGCAGGVRINLTLPEKKTDAEGNGYSVFISGFAGGHSGEDINKGRLNAIRELARITSTLTDVRISDISGGSADNVIPSSAGVKLVCREDADEVKRIFNKAIEEIKTYEPLAEIEISPQKCNGILTAADTGRLLDLIAALPFGVYAMSKEIEGMVETSNNIGIIELCKECCKISLSVRSSVDGEKLALAERIEKTASEFGATFARQGDYPGWKYDKNSRIRELMCRIYKENYGKDAYVHTIHAGLECGIFTGKLEGLDCISMGPNNDYIHTAEETLSLPSFERTYKYIKSVLKEI